MSPKDIDKAVQDAAKGLTSPVRSGTRTVPITGGPDALTQNNYVSEEVDADAASWRADQGR